MTVYYNGIINRDGRHKYDAHCGVRPAIVVPNLARIAKEATGGAVARRRDRERVERNDLISVIVPIGERTQYLEACLDSVVNQTYRNLEVICVLDGHESGLEVVESFKDSGVKVRSLRAGRGGPGVARNAGLDEAVGDFIVFCDADDVLPPRALEHYMRRIDGVAAEIDVVLGAFVEQYDSGAAVECSLSGYGDGFERFFTYISVWNRMYRRGFLEDNSVRFADRSQGEDLLFIADVFVGGPKTAVVDDVVYQWNRHETDDSKTLSHSADYEAIMELIGSWDLFLSRVGEAYPQAVARQARESCQYILGRVDRINDAQLHRAALSALRLMLDKMGWEKFPARFFGVFGYDLRPKTRVIVRNEIAGQAAGSAARVSVSQAEVSDDCYFAFIDAGREVVSGYLRSGETMELSVPAGDYSIRFVCGSGWLGRVEKFAHVSLADVIEDVGLKAGRSRKIEIGRQGRGLWRRRFRGGRR
jgi:glycosyltransferase involved in cell wall biosynthesis